MSPPPDALSTFTRLRPRLSRIAYRMLGSQAEAEDMVQEAWLRWAGVDHADVMDGDAYLVRLVSRLCLDQMRSARARHETYIGPWLPEPIIDPDDSLERGEQVTLALMLALERLSPLERASFLLHDVFGQPFAAVAATLDMGEAACRQLASRARAHIQASGRAFPWRPSVAGKSPKLSWLPPMMAICLVCAGCWRRMWCFMPMAVVSAWR